MLTKKQKKWIDHLSDDDQIVIKPYDPTCQEKFESVKEKIRQILGKKITVEHCGATALGISGQDEIDVYVPVSVDKFDKFISLLSNELGQPRSHYPLERARFVIIQDGKHVDIFLINRDCKGWTDSRKFEDYLRKNPKTLKEYEELKESGAGQSTRQYYQRKIEFINKVLRKTKLSEKGVRTTHCLG